MENLYVALSNAVAVYPIWLARERPADCWLLVGVALASAVSHLVENHKHDMPGVLPWLPPRISFWINRVDAIFAFCAIARFSYLYLFYAKSVDLKVVIVAIVAVMVNLISESDTGKLVYIPWHIVWHLMAFSLVANVLQSI